MEFIPIDIEQHRDYLIPFRKDSFIVSFGTDEGLGDEEKYLDWVQQQAQQNPKGFVLVVENGTPIGQLELTLKPFAGKEIGYVNLYYLVPEKRGMGLGLRLHAYAMQYFKDSGLNEYHLRVSPTNKSALAFYKKNGMEPIDVEFDGKVIRMAGCIW